jgi:MFS family permease
MMLYIMIALGNALFSVAASSVVPQLVPTPLLSKAMQQSQAIQSMGMVLGGVVAGALVTLLGVSGAFLIDGISYLIAVAATLLIVASTQPDAAPRKARHPVAAWLTEVKDGFQMVYKIPVLFWLSVVYAFLYFAFAPIHIAMPVLAKQARGMPPWFLGALFSSVSGGLILTSFLLDWLSKRIYADILVVLGLVTIGIGTLLLPVAPGTFLPLLVMLSIGAGMACCSVTINMQTAIALPDNFRARAGSITSFMYKSAEPLGTVIGGVLISAWGLKMAMAACGIAIALAALPLYLVPRFVEFYRLPPERAAVFFRENYPDAFR